MPEECGADEGNRTSDLRVTSALLYQLSYIGNTGADYMRTARDTATLSATGKVKHRAAAACRSFHSTALPRSPSPSLRHNENGRC